MLKVALPVIVYVALDPFYVGFGHLLLVHDSEVDVFLF